MTAERFIGKEGDLLQKNEGGKFIDIRKNSWQLDFKSWFTSIIICLTYETTWGTPFFYVKRRSGNNSTDTTLSELYDKFNGCATKRPLETPEDNNYTSKRDYIKDAYKDLHSNAEFVMSFGLTYEQFLDLDYRKFYILARSKIAIRERELNDDLFIGIHNALKTALATHGDRKALKFTPVTLPKEDTENSVIEQRNAKVLATLKRLGVIK